MNDAGTDNEKRTIQKLFSTARSTGVSISTTRSVAQTKYWRATDHQIEVSVSTLHRRAGYEQDDAGAEGREVPGDAAEEPVLGADAIELRHVFLALESWFHRR